jgi:hypothetical protein
MSETDAPALPACRVAFDEGSILLPPGYEDRTTNLFMPADPQSQATLSIARDRLRPAETLDTYVDRQLALLQARLASHKLLARGPEWLGPREDAGGPACKGCRIDASYKNGKLQVYQRQAAFLLDPARALIFTASAAQAFGPGLDRLWADWLASYALPSAATTIEAAEA